MYYGSAWIPFKLLTGSRLTTGKLNDSNKPVRESATSATINGVLVNAVGVIPTETGIVWREVINNDFSIPVLNNIGTESVPTYNTVTNPTITTNGAVIGVTIPTLTSTDGSRNPYSFRTYVKNSLGIGYGNNVIFNGAPPKLSDSVMTYNTSGPPSFVGTLTVNACTPSGTVTDYGCFYSTEAAKILL